MGQSSITPITIEKLADNLATFAVNRDDLKSLLAAMPASETVNLTSVEYELQILKILSVGWGISFYMEKSSDKKALTHRFWEHVREIAKNISQLALTTTGKEVDYFTILKTRMDNYVAVMKQNGHEGTDPSFIMGPAFADACQSPDDAAVILTGTKMFTLTLGGVKEYLNAVEITE